MNPLNMTLREIHFQLDDTEPISLTLTNKDLGDLWLDFPGLTIKEVIEKALWMLSLNASPDRIDYD